MRGIEAAIVEHAFQHLFIECLGWDRVQITDVSMTLGDSQFTLQAIAQKAWVPGHRLLHASHRACESTTASSSATNPTEDVS